MCSCVCQDDASEIRMKVYGKAGWWRYRVQSTIEITIRTGLEYERSIKTIKRSVSRKKFEGYSYIA